MNELEEDTERHFQMNMRRNSKRGELIRQKLVQFYEKMTVDYLDKMYEVTRKRYSNNNTLHEMHESFKAAVIHEIKTTVTFENIQQETINICCAILEESYEQVKNAPNNDGQGGKSGFVMNLGAAIGAFIRRSNRPKTIEQDTNASCFPSVIYLRSLNIGEKLENI
uniref:Uncharacterized protein n=1 Tax=Ciona savignyi TaxID=51511 RepID=H2YD42_CIOSA